MTSTEIVVIGLVVVALLLVVVFVGGQLTRLRARLADAETALAELAAELDAVPADIKAILGDGDRQLITIEILNPVEVASTHSKLAKRVAGIAPKLLRREVTKRAVQEIETALDEQGIEAEVRVHDAAA